MTAITNEGGDTAIGSIAGELNTGDSNTMVGYAALRTAPAIGRKAPTSPAKLQKVNVVMKGNDGRLWKVKMVTKQDGTKYKKWVLA